MKMTSKQLFDKMQSWRHWDEMLQKDFEGHFSFNPSGMYTRLIKDAARCNRFSSDVLFDINTINDRIKEYTGEEEFEPIWIGFRKDGVDGTNYVLTRINDEFGYHSALSQHYFALYSVTVEKGAYDMWYVHMYEYPM